MEQARFEGLLRRLAGVRSRREFLAVLGAAALAALPGPASGATSTDTATGNEREESIPALARAWLGWITRQQFLPILASGAVDCAAGQEGATWFLAGSDLDAGPVSRRCTIPAETRLFVPVVSAFCAEPQTAGAAQGTGLSTCAASFVDLFPRAELRATVNGESVPLTRAASPLRSLLIAPDNPFAAPAGEYLQAADGYWALLDPLPPGNHTIRLAAADDFDVTYELTVT